VRCWLPDAAVAGVLLQVAVLQPLVVVVVVVVVVVLPLLALPCRLCTLAALVLVLVVVLPLLGLTCRLCTAALKHHSHMSQSQARQPKVTPPHSVSSSHTSHVFRALLEKTNCESGWEAGQVPG